MTTFTGTQNADAGLYLNTKRFTITMLERKGPLPGNADDTYRRVPALLMLAVAPLVGLVYVIFLPFIGFAAVATLAGSKAMEAANAVAEQRGWARRRRTVPALADPTNAARSEQVQDAANPPKQ